MMRKRAYRIAEYLQQQLHGAALAHPPDQWAIHVPRVQLDGWASLWRWHQAGEPVWRITEAEERDTLAAPPRGDVQLATCRLRREAVACILPDRRDWIVIARHAPAPAWVPVYCEHGWAYAQPLVTWCGRSDGEGATAFTSGYVSLLDQPTPADVVVLPGTVTDLETERSAPITEAQSVHDDYRLALALAVLLR